MIVSWPNQKKSIELGSQYSYPYFVERRGLDGLKQTPLKVKTFGKLHNIYQILKKSLNFAPRWHPNQFEAVN